MFFSHLKKLWDEYASLVTLRSNNCATAKAYVEHNQHQHLLQFLMGLNDSYGHVRSQILMMNPLPSVNQAYSILSQEESQRNLSFSSVKRSPTPLLANRTPFEVLFNKSTSFGHIKVFGCFCYASNFKPIDKFDVRAKPYVFLCYPIHQKGYKLLDLSTNQFIVSRDVIFHEDIFSFSTKSSLSSIFPKSPSLIHDDSPLFSSSNSSTIDNSPTPSVSISSSISPVATAPLRQSTRLSKPPIWTTDYVCSNISLTYSSSTAHSISTYLNYSKLSLSYQSFLASVSTFTEPQLYHEAASDPNWREAMTKEIAALEANQTWDIVPLPSGKKPIGCRWVYKVKYKVDGRIERFKPRLVAKGYTQHYGTDYVDTLSPVVKL